jgi:peptidyl-prolyl cis-trans isomerase C
MRPARFPFATLIAAGAMACSIALAGAAAPKSTTKPATKSSSAAKSSAAKSSAAKKPAKAVPESLQVLVRVGNETITRADVQRRLNDLPEQYRANYSTPDGRQQLLDRMVEEKIWMMGAKKAGVESRPQVQRQLDQQRRDFVIRTYLNEVMAANPAPSDSAIRAYYDAHVSEYRLPGTVTLRHIQSKSEADSKRILGWLKQKQDWDKLCLKYSTDTLTRSNGGQLGAVTKEGAFASIGRQPALAESAFALGEGKIGGPWKTDRGWHVVQVQALRPESVRPYDQVRPVIARQLSSTSSQEFYKNQLDQMKRTIGVSADSAAIKGFVSQKKSARDLFKEAQDTGPAAQRIELYRQLLALYPEDEVSPQALFMIGFIQSEEMKDHDAADGSFRELLARYPKSELAASAQWMLEHGRSEDTPAFLGLDADSTSPTKSGGKKPPAWHPKDEKRKP